MSDITTYEPASGRYLKENNTTANIANIWGDTGVQVFDGTATMNGTTPVVVAVASPAVLSRNGNYLITIINPSASRTATITVQNVMTFSAVANVINLTSFTCAPSINQCAVVQGWLIGDSGKLSIVYDGAGTDTVNIRVHKI